MLVHCPLYLTKTLQDTKCTWKVDVISVVKRKQQGSPAESRSYIVSPYRNSARMILSTIIKHSSYVCTEIVAVFI